MCPNFHAMLLSSVLHALEMDFYVDFEMFRVYISPGLQID